MYDELLQLNKKTNNQVMKYFTVGKIFEQIFTKEDVQTANKHTKRCSTFVIMKMQTKAIEIPPHTYWNG